jgi:hypothetical protein
MGNGMNGAGSFSQSVNRNIESCSSGKAGAHSDLFLSEGTAQISTLLLRKSLKFSILLKRNDEGYC